MYTETHHMHAEILEQPQAIARTLRIEEGNVRAVARAIRETDIEFVVVAARGTSDNAGQLAKYLIEYINGRAVSMAAPSIHTLYRASLKLDKALVLGISQSGEGPDVVRVLEQARAGGAITVGITNNEDSVMARTVEYPILCRAGLERSVAATKTFLTQLMALYMLSFLWADRGDLFGELREIPQYVERVLTMEEVIQNKAERYRYMSECVVIGRGLNYCTAFEAALKMKETSYVVAEPYSSADFLHGPVALIEEGFPAFLVAPPGEAFRDMAALMEELKKRGAETIVLSSNPEILTGATTAFAVPFEVREVFTPLVYTVPLQLFSYHLARVKGLDPDRPRGLKKVTLTT